MATHTLEPHLIESLRTSAREILEALVFMTPTSIEIAPEDRGSFSDEVVGVLGFTGTSTGTFVVRTTETMARNIAEKMLMVEPGGLDGFSDAAEAFAEVVSMLAASFRNQWIAMGREMDLAVPNVIHKGRVTVRGDGRDCLRFRVSVGLEGGDLDIGVHCEAKG